MARVVVVGAGMGGMATAARLAVAGHRVTVLERGERAGGAAGRFERDGFVFDTGPGLLWLPAVWRDVFVKTGKRPLEECVELRQVDPAAEHLFADGTRLRLPGFSRGGVGHALDTALGAGAGERWHAFQGRARQTWEATRRPLVEEPLTSAAGRAALVADRYPLPPARRSGLLRRRAVPAGPPTLTGVAERELGDPRLTAMLAATVAEWGVAPERAPASAAVLAYVEQTFGTWYPVGGIAALVEAVRLRCEERGVEFVFGATARRVLERDGRAAGVELAGGERVAAEHVVWSAPGLGAPPPGESRFTVLVALDGPRPPQAPHRLLVHPADGGPVVRVLRPDDATLWPGEGAGDHHTAVVSAMAPPQGAVDWRDAATTDRWTRRLLAAAGLENIRWQEVRTPLDLERETGLPGGVIPPPALAGADGALLAAPNTGRLPGTWRAGSAAHPGGGLAHAGMTGALVTGLIVEGPGWRGSY
ncbi:NAD(P)/FAD-dependent oxidoreductase [Streptomyces sp. XM4011]|uniref:phytoene desaturase family protein n=1 Tax=Streptomyces sp. XM4011 TaxID=2929780 RepID=UPI001FFC2724|nr:NAD(P)/FAD-dependent oxidoreductase [Streptomyces sp. XM4011]MCK1815737.1 NAD(P)/FAD-dependent oxidoreductase [Streptomyces sp. XM4011]